MPPILASVLCFGGVAFLVVRDVRQHPGVSHALWIPLLWLLIIASRLPSEWVGGGLLQMSSGAAYMEGSPLDRNIFLALIVLGVLVLARRSVAWSSVVTVNLAVTLFFAYTFLSIVWTDFPIVAFKRWHKVLGHAILVLVVLTDKDPDEALAALLRRCAFILLPYSVLYLKYYPELGRGFDAWTGAAVNTGITTNKNALGNLCMITGIFYTAMMCAGTKGQRLVTGMDRWIGYGFLYMIGWLMIMAQSSTSLVAALAGVATIVGIRMRLVRRRFSGLMLTGCAIVLALYFLTPIKDVFITSLGEDATLTGRTELWEDIGGIYTNPIIGTGFESFWLGERLEWFWAKYWWKPNQAHNGYLEMYLNLGLIGVFLQLWMIVSGYRKGRKLSLAPEAPPEQWQAVTLARAIGEFRMAFMLGLIAFNFTDATFKALHPSFFIFFLVALDNRPALAPSTVPHPAVRSAAPARQPATVRKWRPAVPAGGWARAVRPSSLQRTR